MGLFSDMKNFFDYLDVESRDSRENKLYSAISNNNLESVQYYLGTSKGNIKWEEVVLRYDSLALYEPCRTGNLVMVKELLRAGIPINTRDSSELSAIDYAIHYKQKEISKLLIEHGAKVNKEKIIGQDREFLNAIVEEMKEPLI